MSLTREQFKADELRRLIVSLPGADASELLSQAEIDADRRETLARRPAGQPFWVFGYGSLIWNPAFHFAERRRGRLYGLHRRFCLWSPMGRGTRECPGLILGLDRGGSCHGLAFRIDESAIEEETDILWRREQIAGSYRAHWVKARTDEGPIQALVFIMRRELPRYAGALPVEAVARTLARAEGPLGTNCDYLFGTVRHLEESGIPDPHLTALARRVRELRGEPG